jgi:hypothetical protein
MLPLLVAICLDFYLIARIITGRLFASLLTIAIAALFASLWFVLPRLKHRTWAGRAVAKQAYSCCNVQGDKTVNHPRVCVWASVRFRTDLGLDDPALSVPCVPRGEGMKFNEAMTAGEK